MNTVDTLHQDLIRFLEQELPPYMQVRNLTQQVEKAIVAFAIRRAKGNRRLAGEIIGCGRVTVRAKLDFYALDVHGHDASDQPPRLRRNGSYAHTINA